MKWLLACVCFFLQTLGISAQSSPNVIVFQHANVIDGISNEPLRDVTVTIADGKIDSIQRRPKRPPLNAQIIDLNGKWLMPGYIDAHVHFASFDAAMIALSLGTTTVRTMHCEHFVDLPGDGGIHR